MIFVVIYRKNLGGDYIDYLVKLFFISFIINILVVFYSFYVYFDSILFKDLRNPFHNAKKS